MRKMPIFCLLFSLLLINYLKEDNCLKVAANNEIFGMSIDENNNVDYITYDEFHKYDNLNISNEAYISTKVDQNMINGISSTLIFGEDNRTQLNNSQYSLFPYSAVCIVKGYFDTDGDGDSDVVYTGTGALIGPSTVLTSSTIVYHSIYGWKKKTEVIPARYKTTDGTIVNPFGIISNVTGASIGNFHNTGSPNDAWAILDLGVDIGNETGYFGTTSTDISVGSTIKLIGYHGDIPDQISYGHGTVTYLETYKFYHNCDAISGSSGGPITYGTTTVVGIHSGGVNQNEDAACKVSSYIVGWINERLNS